MDACRKAVLFHSDPNPTSAPAPTHHNLGLLLAGMDRADRAVAGGTGAQGA